MATALSVQPPSFGSSSNKLGVRGNVEIRKVRLKGSGRKELVDDTSLTPSSEDPLRILAPGQKKLSTIESQRVLAVMEEAIKRMKNCLLIPIFSSSLDRYSVSLGAELVGMVKEYRHLTAEYNRLYSELEQQGSAPNLDDSNDSADAYASSMEGTPREQHGSVCSFTSSTHLEPLDQGPATTEAKFQQIRFRLKNSVKCILRAMHRNPSTSSLLAPTSSGTPRNAMMLQEEMR